MCVSKNIYMTYIIYIYDLMPPLPPPFLEFQSWAIGVIKNEKSYTFPLNRRHSVVMSKVKQFKRACFYIVLMF